MNVARDAAQRYFAWLAQQASERVPEDADAEMKRRQAEQAVKDAKP